jgi:hypothetical protein
MSQSYTNFILTVWMKLNYDPCAWSLADSGVLSRRIPFKGEHFHGKKAEYLQTLASSRAFWSVKIKE